MAASTHLIYNYHIDLLRISYHDGAIVRRADSVVLLLQPRGLHSSETPPARRLDLTELRQRLADYSNTRRPSIDPELMIRMLIVGYSYSIRSERRLCEEVHLDLANRWFCRLGLENAMPDHSTFSKNRHGRFRASQTFHWIFDEVVRRCMAAGLVKGEGFAVDTSIIAADASGRCHYCSATCKSGIPMRWF